MGRSAPAELLVSCSLDMGPVSVTVALCPAGQETFKQGTRQGENDGRDQAADRLRVAEGGLWKQRTTGLRRGRGNAGGKRALRTERTIGHLIGVVHAASYPL